MRDIKFRGYSKTLDKWVYGDLLYNNDKPFAILPRDADYFDEYIEIDSQSVEQYTGLKDKTGNKIYEGDTLIIPDMTSKFFKVEYFEGVFWITATREHKRFESDTDYSKDLLTKSVANQSVILNVSTEFLKDSALWMASIETDDMGTFYGYGSTQDKAIKDVKNEYKTLTQ